MELYSGNEYYKLYHGNMLDMLEVIEIWTIDSIVCDPPYELNFMWKWWDNSGIAFQPDTRKKCLDVLKPWGYLLAFWGSRTFHRIACAIEDAGFEIRDTIMWLYGSWFPKSLNIWKMIDKKQGNERIKTGRVIHHAQKWVAVAEERWAVWWWAFGEARDEEETVWTSPFEWWGTALKPSYEPIIVARKPLEWSCTDNVIKYGVGGINIDECRVQFWNETDSRVWTNATMNTTHWYRQETWNNGETAVYKKWGRFPANTILTYDESDFDEVCGGFPNTKSWSKMTFGSVRKAQPDNTYQLWFTKHENSWQTAPDNYWDSGSACRYFYAAKASKRDRDEWLGTFAEYTSGERSQDTTSANVPFNRSANPKRNVHPCVKPTDLMQYLVRLVTPNGWTVLDPFNWSGSTGKAVMYENKDRHKNYKYIWIELTEEYLPIAKARIEYVINKVEEKPEWPIEQPLF